MKEASAYFGRLGGLERAKRLTAAERSAIGKKAVEARWKNHKRKRPAPKR
jgi:hypothetical protein